jgi:hypothetical protein
MSRVLGGLTAEQINSDYALTQIQKLQTQTDDVTVNSQYFQYDNTLDNANIGRNTIDENASESIIIGRDNEIIGTAPIIGDNNNNIIIGDRNTINGKQNIVIGSFNVLDDVQQDNFSNYNLLITKNLTLLNIPDGTEDVIILSPYPLNVANRVIPSGSMIFGNNTNPSSQPLLQFGGPNLNDVLPTAPLVGNPDAYIRIRYKNANYKIPVWNDNDAPNPPPPE